jgi:hypothetical protein
MVESPEVDKYERFDSAILGWFWRAMRRFVMPVSAVFPAIPRKSACG